jgi:hypothetical protein
MAICTIGSFREKLPPLKNINEDLKDDLGNHSKHSAEESHR